MADNIKRHGLVTAWLIFMIITNAFSAVLTPALAGSSIMGAQFPDVPAWTFPLLTFLSVVNIVCAIALFMWKKWGFYGFCATTFVAFITNLSIGLGLTSSIFGIVGLAILYGVLHIGNERKAWPNLV